MDNREFGDLITGSIFIEELIDRIHEWEVVHNDPMRNDLDVKLNKITSKSQDPVHTSMSTGSVFKTNRDVLVVHNISIKIPEKTRRGW
jgi:hypothetical protein